MATTNRLDSLDAALRRPGRFDRELTVPAPSARARRGILQQQLCRMAHNVPDAQLHAVSDTLHGFVAADIVGLCQEAGIAALQRFVAAAEHGTCGARHLLITEADLRAAAHVVTPSGMREVAVEMPQVCIWGMSFPLSSRVVATSTFVPGLHQCHQVSKRRHAVSKALWPLSNVTAIYDE